MKAVILAAGASSRLRPLTDNRPKCLLPVGGIPLLERTLRAIQQAEIRDLLIVTGYLREQVEEFVGHLDLGFPVEFVHNAGYERTGNNYSLWLAGEKVSRAEMLLLDSDILFDTRILENLLRAPVENALVVRSYGGLGKEEMKVECDPQGYVIRISKEIDPHTATGESLGIEKFSSRITPLLFRTLEARRMVDEFYEDSFQAVIDQGVKILAVDAGPFACAEIDTEEDLRAAEQIAGSILQPFPPPSGRIDSDAREH